MEKNNNPIAAQAFIILCTFALPFISLYCQDAPKGRSRQRTTTRRPKKGPVRISSAPTTTKPKTEDAVEPAQEAPTTEGAEATKTATTEENIKPIPLTQQTQPAAQPSNAWAGWYNTLAPLFLATVYKGSTAGINKLTNAVIKLFIVRRDTLAKREELEKEKEQLNLLAYLSTEAGQQKLKTLPEEQQEAYKEWQTISPKDISNLAETLSKKENMLIQQEKQTSIPAIMGTGAYIGLINTAILVMGTLMGSAIGSALQMLMPVYKS